MPTNDMGYDIATHPGDVRLVHDCMICQREVIILAQRKGAKLPKQNSILPQVCDECREKYLSQGVLLINPDNCNFVVVKDEAFSRIFDSSVPKGKIAFTEQKVLDMLNTSVETSTG